MSFFRRSSQSASADCAFRSVDSDGDGLIALDQCSAAAAGLAWPPPARTRIKYLLERHDANKDGMIDLQEFKKLVEYLQRGHAVQDELAEVWGIVEALQAELRSAKEQIEQLREAANSGVQLPPPPPSGKSVASSAPSAAAKPSAVPSTSLTTQPAAAATAASAPAPAAPPPPPDKPAPTKTAEEPAVAAAATPSPSAPKAAPAVSASASPKPPSAASPAAPSATPSAPAPKVAAAPPPTAPKATAEELAEMRRADEERKRQSVFRSSWNASEEEVVAQVTGKTSNRRLTISEELKLLEEATKKQAESYAVKKAQVDAEMGVEAPLLKHPIVIPEAPAKETASGGKADGNTGGERDEGSGTSVAVTAEEEVAPQGSSVDVSDAGSTEVKKPMPDSSDKSNTDTDAAGPSSATKVEVESAPDPVAAAPAPKVGGPAPGIDGLTCFLVYQEASQGSLIMQWSKEPVAGALASFAPSKPVPKFKLTANGGRSELARDLNQNRKRLFETFCGFARQAKQFAAPLSFLANLAGVPVALYVSDKSLAVLRLDLGGDSISIADMNAVACVPELSSGFSGVSKMQTALFQQTGQKLGAAMML